MAEEQMTPEREEIFNSIYLPHFLQKLAELGRVVQDGETLQHAVQLTARIKQAVLQQNTNSIKEANLELMRATGEDVREAEERRESTIKTAAHQIGSQPDAREILLKAANQS